MYAYCNNNPVNLADERGDWAVYVTIPGTETSKTYYGMFFTIEVSASLKTIAGSSNENIPCSISIEDRSIDITIEDRRIQYSFFVDDNKAGVGVGCVFDKTAYKLSGSLFSNELTCSIETEVADGIFLEVDITVTSDNRGMLDRARAHASPFLAAAGAALAYGIAYGWGGGRPVYAMIK